MTCPVCNNKHTQKVFDKFPGYVEGTFFDILSCNKCNTQYVPAEKIDSLLYEKIYNKKIEGYDRYFEYSKIIRKKRNPLKYLGMQEVVYYPVYSFLKNKKNLKVLEIGCGYGYLTYSINKTGNNATGIDISKKAISFATKKFGRHYKVANITKYISPEKYDVIIAIELIEHVNSPSEFISSCIKMLNPKGKLILTTPNKDAHKKQIWKTESPPVHITWLSKKSFLTIAKKNKLDINFVNYMNYIPRKDNILLNNILSAINKNPSNLTRIKATRNIKHKSTVRKYFLKFGLKIMNFWAVKYPCNILSKILFKEEPNIGVILTKNK